MTVTLILQYIERRDPPINPLKTGNVANGKSGENTEYWAKIQLAQLEHSVIDGKADQLGAALKLHFGHDVSAVGLHRTLGNA